MYFIFLNVNPVCVLKFMLHWVTISFTENDGRIFLGIVELAERLWESQCCGGGVKDRGFNRQGVQPRCYSWGFGRISGPPNWSYSSACELMQIYERYNNFFLSLLTDFRWHFWSFPKVLYILFPMYLYRGKGRNLKSHNFRPCDVDTFNINFGLLDNSELEERTMLSQSIFYKNTQQMLYNNA